MKNICCGSASCPCAAFIPAQPATEDERQGDDDGCWHEYKPLLVPHPNVDACIYCSKKVPAQPPRDQKLYGPASEVPDLQAGIERVLGEHREEVSWRVPITQQGPLPHSTVTTSQRRVKCSCGLTVPIHSAHLAAAIVAYLHRKEQSE